MMAPRPKTVWKPRLKIWRDVELVKSHLKPENLRKL